MIRASSNEPASDPAPSRIQAEHTSRSSVLVGKPSTATRRNLPRASHACQWCRVKKAKCDQCQPCAHCVKHSVACVYGIRRNRKSREQSQSRDGEGASSSGKQAAVSSRTYSEANQDKSTAPISEPLEQARRSPAPGMRKFLNIHLPQRFLTSAQVFAAQPGLPVECSGGVGDINHHTNGTEFYGTSSNFVLLNQFFAHVKQHLAPKHINRNNDHTNPTWPSVDTSGSVWTFDEESAGLGFAISPQGRTSIINLLSNEEALLPPSRPKTPVTLADKQQDSSGVPFTESESTGTGTSVNPTLTRRHSQCVPVTRPLPASARMDLDEDPSTAHALRSIERRVERGCVRSFMDNLHHLHPMLDSIAFIGRCEAELWGIHAPPQKRNVNHFLALYNIAVAVGALVATSLVNWESEQDIQLLFEQSVWSRNLNQPMSLQVMSKHYFRKSRALLGDIFEVCSLESAQTLLLMVCHCRSFAPPPLTDFQPSLYTARTL